MTNHYVRSLAVGTGTGASWTNAWVSVASISVVTGDTVFVADDHNESSGAGITLAAAGTVASPTIIVCADHTVATPGPNDLKTTAVVTTTAGSTAMVLTGSAYYYGITFDCGGGQAVANTFTLFTTLNSWNKMEACAIRITGTSTSNFAIGAVTIGQNTIVELINTTMQFGAVGSTVAIRLCNFTWRNTASAVTGATIPTNLFSNASAGNYTALIDGVDLSAISTTLCSISTTGLYWFTDCKLNASVGIAAAGSTPGQGQVDLIRCDSAATNYRTERYRYEGNLTTEIIAIRTGGASDGTTPVSWHLISTANAKWIHPFIALPATIWNAVSGSTVTVTVYGIYNGAGAPNNDDVWVDIEYLGTSGFPLGTIGTTTKANQLATGSPVTADTTSAWDSAAPARQNTHAYVLTDIIKVASNPGRLFFCSQAGTSTSPEPGGYASATDGSTAITDGTAKFQPGYRFSLSLALSTPQPQLAGYLRVIPKVGKASAVYYIDPLITLS